jgi:hypothetical protein
MEWNCTGWIRMEELYAFCDGFERTGLRYDMLLLWLIMVLLPFPGGNALREGACKGRQARDPQRRQTLL